MQGTVQTTYGELKNGDIIYEHGIPMTVSGLERYMVAKNPPDDMTGVLTVRFTGTFDQDKYAWARGYSGGRYGAYAWVRCTILQRRARSKQSRPSGKPRLTR